MHSHRLLPERGVFVFYEAISIKKISSPFNSKKIAAFQEHIIRLNNIYLNNIYLICPLYPHTLYISASVREKNYTKLGTAHCGRCSRISVRQTSCILSRPQHLSRCLEWSINMPDSTPCASQRQWHVTALHAPQSRPAHPVNLPPADRPWKSPSDRRLQYWLTLSSNHSSVSASLNCCHSCVNNPIVVVEWFSC